MRGDARRHGKGVREASPAFLKKRSKRLLNAGSDLPGKLGTSV
jgi:hypothetical protein